jgi:hypothetical protein
MLYGYRRIRVRMRNDTIRVRRRNDTKCMRRGSGREHGKDDRDDNRIGEDRREPQPPTR